MRHEIAGRHEVDKDGDPSGGETTGRGIGITVAGGSAGPKMAAACCATRAVVRRRGTKMDKTMLCENCNSRADGAPTRVVIEGGVTVDAVPMGRQIFPHPLCRACVTAVAEMDFAEYAKRHKERPRTMELP
jgi:hypothetical protein